MQIADRAQKLISSSMSRHLSTCNISSISMHAFLSNHANRQTDRQTDKQMWANAFTSSFVRGNIRLIMHSRYYRYTQLCSLSVAAKLLISMYTTPCSTLLLAHLKGKIAMVADISPSSVHHMVISQKLDRLIVTILER